MTRVSATDPRADAHLDRSDRAAGAPEAVIVAGGFGTRMLPLTERRPKHLLEVGGVPFLEHQITKLAAAGVEHIVLATSYRAELFRTALGYPDLETFLRAEWEEGFAGCRAANLYAQAVSWLHGDISAGDPYGGDLSRALAAIRALSAGPQILVGSSM